jgi:hypothetical protein
MAEKLTTFTGTNWSNFGLYSYYFDGDAEAESGASDDSFHQHKARKYFSVSGSVPSAILNLEISWELYHRDSGDGEAEFYVYLKKPDSSSVQLASHSEDAESGDNSGTLQLCDDLDISAELDQTGEYSIEVWCNVKSAWYVPIDDPVYVQSYGSYIGPPSLEVTERFTKTVSEAIGGGESTKPQASPITLEIAGLGESYSVIGGGPDMMKFEKMGFQEAIHAAVAAARAEGAGLAEALARTYSYRQHDVPGIPEGAGLAEYLRARWETGNYVQERDITETADIWEEIPLPETNWEIL